MSINILSPSPDKSLKKRLECPTVSLRPEASTQLSSVHILPPSLPLFPSWYSHMSNGITTASGEVVEEGRKGVWRVTLGGRVRQRKRGIDGKAETAKGGPPGRSRRGQTWEMA